MQAASISLVLREESSLQSLSLSLNNESGELHAQFNPADGMPPPDVLMLRQALADKGWSDFYLDEKAIDSFIRSCHDADAPLNTVVGERRDGEFAITAGPDLQTAYLTLVPPQGGRRVTAEMVDEALRAEGIVFGILREKIDAALATGHCERLPIACGEPMEEGQETRFEVLFNKDEQPSEDDEDEDEDQDLDLERIRYADLCHIPMVSRGDPLMRRVPPAPGKNGTNIKGQILLPRPTPDVPFGSNLKGAERDPDDPNLLVATTGGQPVLQRDGVIVNLVIDVADVDLSTGSIEFEGTLRVRGDVKAGMRVKVGGDVIVNGTVESAEITAGGNVAIQGAVLGHPDPRPGSRSLPDTTARIFCAGSVQALFTENARIEAGKSIEIKRSARQCELIAREEIVVGKRKAGQISGGLAQATQRIVTGTLGAPTGMKTLVHVGLDPYTAKQIAEKDVELKRKVDEVDRVVKLLAYYKQNPNKAAGGTVKKAEGTRAVLATAIDQLTQERNALRETAELSERAFVKAKAEIHFGVEVRISNQVWRTSDDMGGARLALQDNRIIVDKSGR